MPEVIVLEGEKTVEKVVPPLDYKELAKHGAIPMYDTETGRVFKCHPIDCVDHLRLKTASLDPPDLSKQAAPKKERSRKEK